MSPQAQFGALTLGALPRVIGTIVTPEFLQAPGALACDLVEVRLDHLLCCYTWLEEARKIEHAGKPVLMTLRSNLEGGRFSGPDVDRLPYIYDALRELSGVDIELNCTIAEEVANLAREKGKACVLSFHDFEKTPSTGELIELVHRAEAIGGITKISAMANDEHDLQRMRDLLKVPRRFPLCIISMGPLGTETRVTYAAENSCLTYGYLDEPGAPGQLSAPELVSRLRAISPEYAADRLARGEITQPA
jgi:3-dehydroquinate dehydratase I